MKINLFIININNLYINTLWRHFGKGAFHMQGLHGMSNPTLKMLSADFFIQHAMC